MSPMWLSSSRAAWQLLGNTMCGAVLGRAIVQIGRAQGRDLAAPWAPDRDHAVWPAAVALHRPPVNPDDAPTLHRWFSSGGGEAPHREHDG